MRSVLRCHMHFDAQLHWHSFIDVFRPASVPLEWQLIVWSLQMNVPSHGTSAQTYQLPLIFLQPKFDPLTHPTSPVDSSRFNSTLHVVGYGAFVSTMFISFDSAIRFCSFGWTT